MTPLERLEQLLADRATVGLDPAEGAELADLLDRMAYPDPDEFDHAAAVLDRALTGRPAADLPLDLSARLLADAAAFFTPANEALPVAEPLPDAEPVRRRRWGSAAGWAVAAGLAGVLAWTWWPRPGSAEPTIADRRDVLIAQGAMRFAGPGGRVDWDTARQEGYLEVRGLPPNDPSQRQYQLWIVDAGRPDQEPVDGGVFDVGPDGTALVPVRAALPVRSAAAFAVTAEPAGGVVVSRQPHLIVMAKGG